MAYGSEMCHVNDEVVIRLKRNDARTDRSIRDVRQDSCWETSKHEGMFMEKKTIGVWSSRKNRREFLVQEI